MSADGKARKIFDEQARSIVGTGERVEPDRKRGPSGVYRIRFEDVALYETNTIVSSPGVAALAVITGLSVAVTVAVRRYGPKASPTRSRHRSRITTSMRCGVRPDVVALQ